MSSTKKTGEEAVVTYSMNRFQNSRRRSSASKKVNRPGVRSGSRWRPRDKAICTTSESRPIPAPDRSPVAVKTKKVERTTVARTASTEGLSRNRPLVRATIAPSNHWSTILSLFSGNPSRLALLTGIIARPVAITPRKVAMKNGSMARLRASSSGNCRAVSRAFHCASKVERWTG